MCKTDATEKIVAVNLLARMAAKAKGEEVGIWLNMSRRTGKTAEQTEKIDQKIIMLVDEFRDILRAAFSCHDLFVDSVMETVDYYAELTALEMAESKYVS